MTPKEKLFALDLTPRGETEIDLLGKESEIGFAPWGTTHTSRMRDWTPEKREIAMRETAEAERIVNACSKPALEEFLKLHGRSSFGKRSGWRSSVMVLINDKRYPRVFVNAAPNWYACSCGFEGPAVLDRWGHPRCGGLCDKPRYAMRLTLPGNAHPDEFTRP